MIESRAWRRILALALICAALVAICAFPVVPAPPTIIPARLGDTTFTSGNRPHQIAIENRRDRGNLATTQE